MEERLDINAGKPEEITVTDTADNGKIENVHIAPVGSFVGSDSEGNPVPESITAESLQALADKLNEAGEEVLCDVDHKASKPGLDRDTRSAGWFRLHSRPHKGAVRHPQPHQARERAAREQGIQVHQPHFQPGRRRKAGRTPHGVADEYPRVRRTHKSDT